jgi:hypothetical protein
MLDQSLTASFLTITNALSNTIFDAGSKYQQYEVVNGYLLYDAVYARDHMDLKTITGKDDNSVFLSSAKNGENPSTAWLVGAGAALEKNDLVDVYGALRRDGTLISDDMWLTLAGSTMSTNGDHFVDFELYKEAIELNVTGTGFVNSGPLATEGHSAWTFDNGGNITQTGDLIAGFAFNGETVSGVEVRIWTARANWGTNGRNGLVPNPATFSWGSRFDGSSQSSAYGYAQIIIPEGASYDKGSTKSVLGPPWKTVSEGGVVTANYLAGSFAEVGLNLSAIGLDPGLPSGDPCEAPFQKIFVKSRASSSFNAALKDYVGPYNFLGAPVVDSTIKPDFMACGATQLTISPVEVFIDTLPFEGCISDVLLIELIRISSSKSVSFVTTLYITLVFSTTSIKSSIAQGCACIVSEEDDDKQPSTGDVVKVYVPGFVIIASSPIDCCVPLRNSPSNVV